jgi:CMP/dCMP kinase
MHDARSFIKNGASCAAMAIVTITGTPGSGKSTLAKLLAKRLGYQHYSMGDLQRKLAEDKGISIHELNKRNLDVQGYTDAEVDAYQTRLGKEEDRFVIDSRLGYHFIPSSFKLFVDADPGVRAHRLLQRQAVAETPVSVEHAEELNRERVKNETLRYSKIYGTHPYDAAHYDLVLDSTTLSPEQLVTKVLDTFPDLAIGRQKKRSA